MARECGYEGVTWSEGENATRKVGEGQVGEIIEYWLWSLEFACCPMNQKIFF